MAHLAAVSFFPTTLAGPITRVSSLLDQFEKRKPLEEADGGRALFLIGFFWQLPHILAVGWMYREDYIRARLPVLAAVDPTGAMSGLQAMLWAAALIPVSLLPSSPST